MDIKEFVGRYINDIVIENTDFVPCDDAVSDMAYILLNVPTAMLREYAALKNIEYPPDGANFWNDCDLVNRLRSHKPESAHQPLADILEFLSIAEVDGQYQQLKPEDRIRLSITECPQELYD
jgi:hypothetical protein